MEGLEKYEKVKVVAGGENINVVRPQFELTPEQQNMQNLTTKPKGLLSETKVNFLASNGLIN